MKTTLRKITLPTNEPVADAVTALWLECFGPAEVEGTRAQFAGLETAANIDTLYVLECDGALGACCHITRRLGTGLAMLGGVASAPAFRARGFGRAVCAFAMADFDREGGEAIWLCTGNPVAADLYESLGFHYQAGAHVMARLQPEWHGMKLSRFPPAPPGHHPVGVAMKPPLGEGIALANSPLRCYIMQISHEPTGQANAAPPYPRAP